MKDWDNRALVDGILNPKPSILERAAARHVARTPEEIADIKERWAERTKYNEATKQAAADALMQAKDFAEVDYSLLQQYAAKGDIAGMAKETAVVLQRVAAMKAEEQALGTIIPNVHDWHKKFTLTELKTAFSAIEKKLSQFTGLDLITQKKKLEFEITFVTNPAQYGKKQYSTWEVAADAYKAQAIKVQYQIDVQAATASLAPAETFSAAHKRMTKLASLLQEAKAAINAGAPIAEIKTKVDAALKEYNAKLAKEKKTPNNSPFDADAYSKERKDNALWCKSVQESAKEFDAEALTLWKKATPAQQEAWRAYTGGSGHMNRPLRGYRGTWRDFQGVGNVPLDYEGGAKHIEDMYQLLEGSLATRDMWVQRGFYDTAGAQAFFGGAPLTEAELKKLIGREFIDYSFVSCGAAKGTGFGGPVVMNIYCPRGTKAAYLRPYSHYAKGTENEMLLQAGTVFRVTKVESGARGVLYVDVDVVGYVRHPLL